MTIWEILQLLLTIFEVSLCYWICDSLLEEGHLLNKSRIFLLCVVIPIAFGTAWNRHIAFFSYIIFIQQIILIWITFLWISRKRKGLCFLIVLNYHLIITLLDYIGAYFVMWFCGVECWYSIYYQTSAKRILIFFTSRVIVLFLFMIIQRFSKHSKINLEIYKGLLGGLGIVGCIWVWWFQTTIFTIKDINSLSNLIFVFSCFLVLLAVLVGGFNNIYVKKQAQFIQMKNGALEENYKNLRNLYENNQYMYHDFKNHMTLLKRYMEEEEYHKALEYVNRIVGPMEQLDSIIVSNQEVINLVVNLKGYEANQKGIRIVTDIEDFENGFIEDIDLGNIMMNLLNNAIEACEQVIFTERWISITIKKKHAMLIIRVENSIEKQVNKKDGQYLSNKENLSIHGLGIKSVKTIVEKYDAEADWSNTKDTFSVVITFFKNGL